MRTPTLTLAALTLAAGPLLAQTPETPAPPRATPAPAASDALQWTQAPPGLPGGAEIAVL